MAERLTVTPFPKDIRAIAEYLLKYANAKSAADASHTCGLFIFADVLSQQPQLSGIHRPCLGLAVEELQGIVRNPNGVLLRIKHEDDPNGVLIQIKHEDDPNGVLIQIKHENGDDTEEDGEVSEP